VLKVWYCLKPFKFHHHIANMISAESAIPRKMLIALLANVQAIFRRHTIHNRLPPVGDDLVKLTRWQGTLRGLADNWSATEWAISKKDYSTFRDQALTKGARVAHQLTKLSVDTPSPGTRPNFIEEVQIEEKKWHTLWKTDLTPRTSQIMQSHKGPPLQGRQPTVPHPRLSSVPLALTAFRSNVSACVPTC
jgi:hypothetical protein